MVSCQSGLGASLFPQSPSSLQRQYRYQELVHVQIIQAFPNKCMYILLMPPPHQINVGILWQRLQVACPNRYSYNSTSNLFGAAYCCPAEKLHFSAFLLANYVGYVTKFQMLEAKPKCMLEFSKVFFLSAGWNVHQMPRVQATLLDHEIVHWGWQKKKIKLGPEDRSLQLGAGFTGTFRKLSLFLSPGLKCCFKDLMQDTFTFNNSILFNQKFKDRNKYFCPLSK